MSSASPPPCERGSSTSAGRARGGARKLQPRLTRRGRSSPQRRLGVLQCHSALERLSALVTLRASIEGLERRSCSSSDGDSSQRVRLVLFDNAAAFYWPLRAAGAGGRQQQQQQQQQLNLSTMAAASARALKRALKGSGAAALITRHAVFPAGPYPSAAAPGGKEGEERRGGGGSREFFPASWLSLASRRADLAAVGGSSFAGETPRLRLTWRASAAAGGGGGLGGDAAPQQQPLLFDLTDAGLVPL